MTFRFLIIWTDGDIIETKLTNSFDDCFDALALGKGNFVLDRLTGKLYEG